jgi:hypothetical protein
MSAPLTTLKITLEAFGDSGDALGVCQYLKGLTKASEILARGEERRKKQEQEKEGKKVA